MSSVSADAPPPRPAESEFIAATVERLRQQRRQSGRRLPAGAVEAGARSCGVAPSTLLRYLADGPPTTSQGRRAAWSWDEYSRPAYYRAAGNVTLARALIRAEAPKAALPSLPTMYRAALRDFTPDERELARRGQRAARACRFVCTVREAHRNQHWYADHKLLDIPAIEPRGRTPKRPWLTVIVDGYSRVVVGASVSLLPNRGHVLAALGSAIEKHGMPVELIFDRGKEFLSEAVGEHAAALGYIAHATPPYSPHFKGKVERLHSTLNRRLAAALGTVPAPARDTRDHALLGRREPLPLGQVAAALFQVIAEYNAAPHRALDGCSPLEIYAADSTPEQPVDPAVLRRFLLAGKTRKISPTGLRFHSHHYWAAELEGHVGKTVEIRWAQDDQRRLEVYDGDRHWCTAQLVDPASPAQRDRILAARRAHTERQRQDLRRAKRLAQRQWQAIKDGGGVHETTLLTTGDYEAAAVGHPPEHLSLLAELGLKTDLDEEDER